MGSRRRAPRGWSRPTPESRHRLSHTDVMARIKDHGPSHYSGLFNVMKGVTLAGAGLALVKLGGQGFPAARLTLVAVALTGVLLTYYGQTVGFIVVHLRPSGLDIAFPMLLTVAELYIAYRPGIARGGGLPTDWFEGLAAWAILAALVILSIAWRLKRSNYAPALWPVIQEYKRELREDIVAASALGTLTIAFIVCRGAIGLPSAVDWAFLAVVLTVLGIGINSQWRTKMRLARQLGVEI